MRDDTLTPPLWSVRGEYSVSVFYFLEILNKLFQPDCTAKLSESKLEILGLCCVKFEAQFLVGVLVET